MSKHQKGQAVPELASTVDRDLGARVRIDGVSQAFVHQGTQVVHALDNFSLRIEPSQFVGLVGPSGCGKTTILGMLAGMYEPTVGLVEVDGEQTTSPRRDVGYMLARDALLPWRSAQSNVELGLEARRMPKAERSRISRSWLDRVGLKGFYDSPITKLSQGMRQRVAIARTLALSPRLILMDEPFAALEAQTRAQQQQEFLSLWEAKRPTVVLVTHDLGEAIKLCDRVVLVSHRPGRVIQDIQIDLPRPRNAATITEEPVFRRNYQLLSEQLRREVTAAASTGADGSET